MPKLKNLFYMLYPVHILRNFLQYIIGTAVFYATFGELSLGKIFLGGIAFVLSYQFVYTLNDLIDYKQDIKNKLIMRKKLSLNYPLHSGVVSENELLSFSVIVLLIGFSLSLLINPFFFQLQVILLILNFLYSNPFFRIKSVSLLLYTNIIILQFLKFSLGWFSQTITLDKFPYWLFLFFATIYTITYRSYKSHFIWQGRISSASDLLIFSIFTVSLIFSLVLYSMPLPIISVILIFGLLYSYFRKIKILEERTRKGMLILYLSYISLFLPFILLQLSTFTLVLNNTLDRMIIEILGKFLEIF